MVIYRWCGLGDSIRAKLSVHGVGSSRGHTCHNVACGQVERVASGDVENAGRQNNVSSRTDPRGRS